MMIFSSLPGLIFIAGGALTFLFKSTRLGRLIPFFTVGIAVMSLLQLTATDTVSVSFLLTPLELLRVDTLSQLFGALFVGVAGVSFLYGLNVAKTTEYAAALVYIGSALAVVFTHDLVTLYIFWELMALSSVFLILLADTSVSRKAALRYIIVHLVGGLVLLAGIILHIHATGSTVFDAMTLGSLSSYLIIIGFLVNAAGAPLSSWLSDAYPESTLMGGVILSSITTKTAIYVLMRGFSGTDILIWVGAITGVYGVIYGLLENNVRRSLSFSVINQIGFKLVGIGLGSPLAIAGVCAHVVCGVMYNSVLWMSAGNLIKATGKTTYTELAGVPRRYPWMMALALVGALAIASFPLTSGYTSKTIILKAVEYAHLFTPWLLLEFASFGVILFITCKFMFYGFFYKNDGPVLRFSNPLMIIVTGVVAFGCILLGVMPGLLYDYLPYSDHLLQKVPGTFGAIYTHFEGLIIQCQKFFFAVLGFVLFRRYIPIKPTITIDIDWVYRRLLRYIRIFLLAFVDFIYTMIHRLVMIIVGQIVHFFEQSLSLFLYLYHVPFLRLSRAPIDRATLLKQYRVTIESNGFPFVLIGSFIFILAISLAVLTF
jgi:multicomponent Na+:H+ antiporter subunit D